MRTALYSFLVISFCVTCQKVSELEKVGLHYQVHKDYQSLQQAVDLLEIGSDTAYVRKILGQPINFGFDYRYTVDSTGPNGCTLGAVFHLNGSEVDEKWAGEICE